MIPWKLLLYLKAIWPLCWQSFSCLQVLENTKFKVLREAPHWLPWRPISPSVCRFLFQFSHILFRKAISINSYNLYLYRIKYFLRYRHSPKTFRTTPVYFHNNEISSPMKPLDQSKPNFIWSILGKGERKFI